MEGGGLRAGGRPKSVNYRPVPAFIRLSRRTAVILTENISLALGIKAVFLGLAIAGQATLWMAILADMGVSLLVVFNGMRLLRANAAAISATRVDMRGGAFRRVHDTVPL